MLLHLGDRPLWRAVTATIILGPGLNSKGSVMAEGMRLRAVDVEDLKIISALMQDAIIPMGEIAWLPDDKLFVLMASRFLWEGARADGGPTPDDGGETPERVQCALRFHGVESVRRRGIDLTRRDQFLSLLSMEFGEGAILLHLSGGADIRLEGTGLECRLEDRGLSWPASRRPDHGI